MNTKDQELEAAIRRAWEEINEALTEPAQRMAAARMAELVKKRSPERVEEMEKSRGLR